MFPTVKSGAKMGAEVLTNKQFPPFRPGVSNALEEEKVGQYVDEYIAEKSPKPLLQAEDQPYYNLFSFSSPSENIRRQIDKQKGRAKILLRTEARKSFEKNVPYVFAYEETPRQSLIFDIDGFVESVYSYLSGQQHQDREHGIWFRCLSASTFYVFLDETSPAVLLGSISDLKKIGIESRAVLGRLITPSEWPEQKAQVLYMHLSELHLLSEKFKPYENAIRRKLSAETIESQKEELLIDFAGSDSFLHLIKLLEQGVSPNAFSPLHGVYALHVAKGNKREENVSILLKYGADPDVERQEPAV